MVGQTCKIIKGEEVQKKLLEGSEAVFNAVSTTFGPYGRNVTITREYNVPHVTKDGATVAREIKLADKAQNVAVQIINQAAAKTAEVAGDGTTSTTILTESLVSEAFKAINEGAIAIDITRALRKMEEQLIDALEKITAPVTEEDLYHIALVACNGDDEIAFLVSQAFKKIGKEGVVTVTDSRNYNTTMEATDGIKLDRSHITPSLNDGKISTKHSDVKIAVTNMDIKTELEALHLVKLQEEIGRPLLIICNDLIGTAAEIIAYNKIERKIPIEVIRAPHIAEARKEATKDLAIVTGSTLLDKELGWTIQEFSPSHLGSCDNIEITLKETNIIGRHGEQEEIQKRVEYYKNKMAEDKEGLTANYEKRLAYFTSGAAVIYVGGANESEVKEKKDRLDDTIRAVKSALAEGYVVGGAITYSELADTLDSTQDYVSIMVRGLYSLLDMLVYNSGGAIDENNHLYYVAKHNIIDPTLVVKSTIQNAIGAAIMIFNTDCIVVKEDQ